MRIHLVTYGTTRFRHRQWFLGWSAKMNGIVDTVTHWTPRRLLAAGFEERCPGIKLGERGSGYWAWKPFIIQKKLENVNEGDIVFYCDVGRRFPYKQLTVKITPYLKWMRDTQQDVMPGVSIPWKGPMSMWTKRDAFVFTDTDSPKYHGAIPIQASFSFWRAGNQSQNLIQMWMDLSAQRSLISDDACVCDRPNLQDFHDHRHDQTLLTIACLKSGISALDLGSVMPALDTQHPSEIGTLLGQQDSSCSLLGLIFLKPIIRCIEILESILRKKLSFGEPRIEPSIQREP